MLIGNLVHEQGDTEGCEPLAPAKNRILAGGRVSENEKYYYPIPAGIAAPYLVRAMEKSSS